jgi:hypothetical protein
MRDYFRVQATNVEALLISDEQHFWGNVVKKMRLFDVHHQKRKFHQNNRVN